MLETWVWTDRLQNILKIRWKSIKWDIKQSVEGWKCLTRTHLHYDFVEDFIHKNQSLLSMPNSSYKSQIICQKSIYENIIFQEYIESVWTFGGGGNKHMHAYMHCRCEQILDCTNNPANLFTLIFYSFTGSLWNFRFCQIRPIYPILLFWSK